ncbi:alpha/beta-Hydrolases superfamily protein [Rhynchospora pubera]|uniref:Alpha/beta-Hydrolases superfamily protein n=1 Tax=Rhynchospora pubera TaxID=906938 RepID=A0AAV8FEW9_9POAL|nr:alpha/beta-Hydrolases superfamily protein [Rhynchospora pubera]
MATPQCCQKPPSLDPVYGKGQVVEDFGGLKAYITGSPESKLAIVLISDIFGYEAPLLRNLADKVATSGFFVLVPDFFHGDPATPEILKNSSDEWLEKHGMAKGFEEAKPVIQALREKGFSAIGSAGFCWGGKVVVELAKYDYINAAVSLHPAPLTNDDIREVKCPISILGAEVDRSNSPEAIKQFAGILSTKPEVHSHVKIYPGTEHGWSVRYDVNDKQAVEKAEEAQKDLLDWLVKYVK